MKRTLTLSSASAGCTAAIVVDGSVLASARIAGEIGLAAALPRAVEQLLDQAGRSLDLVAVIVGPGSFTGLRAGIAVAVGVGLGLDIPVIGVSVAEALAGALPALPALDGRRLWTAVQARRGRIFLDRCGRLHGESLQGERWESVAADALPAATGPIAVCGNAAALVAATLAARGTNVMLTDARLPQAGHVAAAALQRLAGRLPPLPPEPLYVDPPEARLPSGGLRAAPA